MSFVILSANRRESDSRTKFAQDQQRLARHEQDHPLSPKPRTHPGGIGGRFGARADGLFDRRDPVDAFYPAGSASPLLINTAIWTVAHYARWCRERQAHGGSPATAAVVTMDESGFYHYTTELTIEGQPAAAYQLTVGTFPAENWSAIWRATREKPQWHSWLSQDTQVLCADVGDFTLSDGEMEMTRMVRVTVRSTRERDLKPLHPARRATMTSSQNVEFSS